MELQGKIIAALPERSGVSARGEWKVQEFVLETTDSQYPRKMVFDVFGADRLQRFNIKVGDEVLVAFDIDAREYNGRWYNSIRAFDVRPAAQSANVAFDAPGADPLGAPIATASTAPESIVAENTSNSLNNAFDAAPDGGSTDNLPF